MNFDQDAHPNLKPLLRGFENLSGSFSVSIEGRFEASHYLYRYFADGSDEPMHGHSWLVRMRLARNDDGIGEDGISLDFLAIRTRFDELLERMEHVCINNLEEFKGINPTAENIARWFFAGVREKADASGGCITEVQVYEGPYNVATFSPS